MTDNKVVQMSREQLLKAFQQNKDKWGQKEVKKLKRELTKNNNGGKIKKFREWLKENLKY